MPDHGKARRFFLVYPNLYNPSATHSDIMLNYNLQEFAAIIGLQVALVANNHKVSPTEAYLKIDSLWQTLKRSRKALYPKGNPDKSDFQYRVPPIPSHSLEQSLQTFSDKVSILCALESNGKISPLETYRQIKALHKQLKALFKG